MKILVKSKLLRKIKNLLNIEILIKEIKTFAKKRNICKNQNIGKKIKFWNIFFCKIEKFRFYLF